MRHPYRVLWAAGALASLLAACGQRGPLQLPEPERQSPPLPASGAPAETDGERDADDDER